MAIKFLNTVAVDTDVLYVDASSNRVGIGTTSPGYKLDVSGDAYIDETLNIETTVSGTLVYGYSGVGAGNLVVGGFNLASFTPAVITLMNQDTTISGGQDLGVLQFGGKDDQTNGYANGQIRCTTAGAAGSGNTGGGIFRFLLSGNTSGSGPTERMRITNTGNVGIGTTSPAKKLTIGGIGINNTDGLKIEDPSNTAYGAHYSYDDASSTVEIGGVTNNVLNDCISIARDATRAITINTSENVGIGTTSPSSKLQVNGDLTVGDDSTVGSFINVIAAGASQDAGIRFGSESNTDSKAAIYTNTVNSDLHFDVTETTRMLIDSGTGNVGIGTTGPRSKLHVVGGVKLGNDTDSPSSAKAGTFRYYTSGNNSYVDMCMRTGASTYAWVNIVTNSW